MTRSYATPLAFKAALEARLHERAARQSRSLNRVRQLLVMERFLARVFPSEAAKLRDEVLAVPGKRAPGAGGPARCQGSAPAAGRSARGPRPSCG